MEYIKNKKREPLVDKIYLFFEIERLCIILFLLINWE